MITVASKRLREQQGKAYTAMKELKKKVEDEGRDFTEEERATFFKMDEDYERYEKEAIAMEKLEAIEEKEEAAKAKPIIKDERGKEISKEERDEIHNKAFCKYILNMIPKDRRRNLPPEDYVLTEREQEVLAQTRAQSTTATEGGHTTAPGFAGEFDKALVYSSGMFEASRILRTSTGSAFDWPTLDDTANAGSLLSENTAAGELDTVWGNVTFNAWKFTSGLIRVSNELIQDSLLGIISITAEAMGERIGRALNLECTTGSGSSRPNGVVTAAASGGTASVSTGLVYGDFTELKHNVNRAYRRNARWMLSDSTLKSVKEMSVGSSDNRPLWIPGIAGSEPSTIDGDPYTINDDVADYAAGNDFLLYGDFSKYIIRMVRDTQIASSTDRYMEVDQLALVGFARFDGDLLNTAAIKKMRAPST